MIRVATHILRVVIASSMDKLTRIAILEGALGVPPWSLTRGDALALSRASEKIRTLLPDIDPDWLSDRDMGVYGAIVQGARSGGGSSELADDVAMSILTGDSRGKTDKDTGATRERGWGELYDVGVKLSSTIRAGGGLGAAKGMLSRHAKQRALDMRRGPRGRGTSLTRVDDDGGEIEFDIPSAGSSSEMDLLAELLENDNTDNIVGRTLQREFHKEFADAPSKMAIFDEWLRDPMASATEIARRLGNLAVYESKGNPVQIRFRTEKEMKDWVKAHPGAIISATQTSKVLRDIWDLARGFFKRHQELLQDVHLQQELAQLGYGSRTAAELKAAKEFAQKFARRLRVQAALLRA